VCVCTFPPILTLPSRLSLFLSLKIYSWINFSWVQVSCTNERSRIGSSLYWNRIFYFQGL
jgi:hypothetical protein